ncbi:glycoside hydrolase family 65 protein [Roseomonas sp. ACRSG]|nr:glycoside hydrolase family 65 protein [Roseomonas sp. ACRSG]
MPYAGQSDILFTHYDPSDERRRETLLALGNGLLLVRAAAPWAQADGTHYPGTYRAGLYDCLTDVIKGEEVSNESVPNLPNWLSTTFRVAGEARWFSLEQVTLLDYRHTLDTVCGTSCREIRFRDAAGRHTRLREQQLVSMADPRLVALRLQIIPEDWSGLLELRSGIDGDVSNSNVPADQHYHGQHLVEKRSEAAAPGLLLLQACTRQSAVPVAVATRTRLTGKVHRSSIAQASTAAIAEEMSCVLAPGESLVLEKVGAIFCGLDDGLDSDGVGAAALAAARDAPDFTAMAENQATAWVFLRTGIGLEAAKEPLHRSLGFHAFHLLQTAAPHVVGQDLGFPARGWQEAYRGQIFWEDTQILPFLDLRYPAIARSLLMYRCRRLDDAREGARRLGYRGAMFPWRSASDGFEKTPRHQFNSISGGWMRDDTHLQRHVGAAIAHAAWRYVLCTGDEDFLAEHGAELILEVARFWASIARHDAATDRYHIRGVVGPDEYHLRYPGAVRPGIDDNTYTNVMAARVLTLAPMVLDRLPWPRRAALCRQMALTPEEQAQWDAISRRLMVPFHDDGVIAQFSGFDRLKPLDIATFRMAHPHGRIDQALDAQGDAVEAYAVSKQADMLMLLHMLPHGELEKLLAHMGYIVNPEQLQRTVAYHLSHCQHDSSLSPVACAGALARLNPEKSWRFFQETLRPDLESGEDSAAAEGAHLGAMGGAIDVLQRHYLGLRVQAEALAIDPAPPEQLGPVRMTFGCRFGRFTLEWTGRVTRLHAADANPAPTRVLCGGERHVVTPGGTLEM